jgi:tRNA wybutosine-synthesizing protein 2
MKYRDYLKKQLNFSDYDTSIIPSGYHVVGHVALLQLKDELAGLVQDIGRVTLEFDDRIRTVAIRSGPTSGIERRPRYVVIAGDSETETIHIENGIKFRLDPLRITFSGGNRRERITLPSRIKSNEIIVDMFACVGQFSLHIARKDDVKVIAIEINPTAYKYLIENITLNKFEKRVQATLGDCREVHPCNIANRIVMGYLHDTLVYLPHALQALVKEGGVIHMHLAGHEESISEYRNTINTICRREEYNPISVKIRRVKHYSPGIKHLVFDIVVEAVE